MTKGGTRQGRAGGASVPHDRSLRAAGSERRVRPAIEHDQTPPRATRANVVRLVAEVQRLELELAAAQNEIAALAARSEADPLTGVLNRRGFERELKRSLAYSKRYGSGAALLYIDLDQFKTINDAHGHGAGDAVLKAVTQVIGRQVRASDIVARIGGDEFAVLLWNLTEQDACTKAEQIEAAIARSTPSHAGTRLSIAASAGATLLLPLDTPAAVLERADKAMYVRKAARRVAEAGDPAP
jgi:diguanylate cyclase (GGDEF)-like protein